MSAGRGLEGLVLDVDDTLYMEHTYVASGFRAVGVWFAASGGVEGLAEVALEMFEAGVRGEILDRALIELGVQPTEELISELVRRYRTHRPDITLLPDARELLNVATDRGIPLAVITDGPAESQRAKIASLGIEPSCDLIIVTSDHLGVRPKPHPSAYKLVQERWGLAPVSLAYVADNPAKDFVAPHRLGWRTVRVRRPRGLHESVPSGPDVDVEIRDLLDSATILARSLA